MHAIALDPAPTRDAWLDQRRSGIGGSDAAAICGYDEWTSPYAVYISKVEGIDSEAGEAARWGNILEGVVAEEACLRIGEERVAAGGTPMLVVQSRQAFQHPNFPWMRANVDRLCYDQPRGDGAGAPPDLVGPVGLLEVKTTHRNDDWNDGPPARVIVQVQHYLEVTGLETAWIAALLADRRFSLLISEIHRDDALIESLLSIEAEFWDRVERREPPAIDGSRGTSDALKRLYATASPGSTINLPDRAAEYLEQLRVTKRLEREISADVERWENEIKALMGDAETALIADEAVATWKSVTSNRVDTTALRAAHPGIAEEFTKPSTSRRFTLKGAK